MATLNLTFPQGATWNLALTWNDDSGDPINLTGYTARMQVRASYDSATSVLALTNGSGLTLGGAAGTITLAVSATQSASVAAANYVYDLELQSGGGEVVRLVEGTLTVTPEVTR
jgi:hypothetical protein